MKLKFLNRPLKEQSCVIFGHFCHCKKFSSKQRKRQGKAAQYHAVRTVDEIKPQENRDGKDCWRLRADY